MADNYNVKVFDGTQLTIRGKDVGGGVIAPMILLTDASGNALLGQKTKALSLPVTLANNPVAAATHSNVTGANADTQLLAANASRVGFTVFNDSTANMFLKYGTAASATSNLVKVSPGGFYEDPWQWQGVVNAFWDAVNGAARIMELT